MNDNALARQLKTNFNMGAGIGISIPLFENRTTKTQVNKAIIQRESIQLDLKTSRLHSIRPSRTTGYRRQPTRANTRQPKPAARAPRPATTC